MPWEFSGSTPSQYSVQNLNGAVMSEVIKIYEKCPVCGATCLVKENEFEPTMGHLTCKCGCSITIELPGGKDEN